MIILIYILFRICFHYNIYFKNYVHYIILVHLRFIYHYKKYQQSMDSPNRKIEDLTTDQVA